MVSNYKRKTERGSYSKENLEKAVKAVKNGELSGYKASQLYKIPRMTIMDHVYNRRTKSNTLGKNTALSPEAEAKLANSLKLMEKYGFGLSRKELLETVGEYVEKNNISTNFKNRTPGQAWFTGFKKRHNLSIKKPQAVEYARKKAIDPFIVYPYFDLLKKTLEELKLTEKPKAIWNLDETSFSRDPEKIKTVGAKGHAATRVISSPGRENTTVLLCANALGEKAPPMVVYKGKNVWDSWISPDAYPNTAYAATANGWMESEIFERYFTKTFLPFIGNERPVLLIYDGHATHVGLNIIEKAREAGVTILKLPAHTSHVLQPLDVSLMKPFKDKWDELLVKWQRLNVGVPLPKKEFARLIGVVWKQIDGKILKNGFRKAGIYPPNVEEIEENHFDSLMIQRWRQHSKKIASYSENSDKIVAQNSPKSLLSLALDCVTREATYVAPAECDHLGQNTTQKIGLALGCSNTLSIIDLEELVPSPIEHEKQENTHQIQDKNKDSEFSGTTGISRIRILEDRVVSFEELLLTKVKAGHKETVKRRKIAPGAEVITHEDVLKLKIEEKIKNIKKEPQTKKGKGIGKKSRNSEKENKEKNVNKPGDEIITQDELNLKIQEKSKYITKELQTKKGKGIGKKSRERKKVSKDKNNGNKCKAKKRTQIISPDSTSVSDCVSIHSDSDALDCDENIFIDTNMVYPMTKERKKSDGSEKEDKEKNIKKRKAKKRAKIISQDSTSVSDCVSIHSDSDDCDDNIFIDTTMVSPITIKETENIKECNEICNNSDRKNDVAMEDSNTPDTWEGGKEKKTENTEDEMNFAINDHVLVRYYSRKKWTYYVGYVEGIKTTEDVHYTVRFYKTVKSPLKFVLSKKVDSDDVPIQSVVKRVHLRQVPHNPKEFVFSDNENNIYFS